MPRRRDLAARRPQSAAAVVVARLVALVAVACLAGPAAVAATVAPPARSAAGDASTLPASPEAGDARFSPVSATFVSTSLGWVLGSIPCGAHRCPQLLHTVDSGVKWSRVPLPPAVGPSAAEQDEVRFADRADGWIYPGADSPGPTTIWATRDGGAHWSAVALPIARRAIEGIEDLEASRGVVTAAVQVGGDVDLFSAPVAGGRWRRSGGPYAIGAGPVPTGELSLQGFAGWFVQVDRVVVDGARAAAPGRWRPWEPPCSRAGGPVLLSAATSTHLDAVCTEGVWTGGPVSVDLLASVDGGAKFGPPRRLPALVSSAEVATAIGPSTIGVGGSDGASPEVTLEMSFDGGATWHPVVRQRGTGWLQLGFTTLDQGLAIVAHAGSQPSSLLLTRDGGRRWRAVAFG